MLIYQAQSNGITKRGKSDNKKFPKKEQLLNPKYYRE